MTGTRDCFGRRLRRVLALLAESEGLLVTDAPGIRYLCGFDGEDSCLLVTQRRGFLITDGRYLGRARRNPAGFEAVDRLRSTLMEAVALLASRLALRRLRVRPDRLSCSDFRNLSRLATKLFLSFATGPLACQRAVKDPSEIALIRRAVDFLRVAIDKTAPFLRPGISEIELKARLEYEMILAGAGEPAFGTIIAFGSNTAVPHAVSGRRRLGRKGVVLMDAGAACEGYRCDLTRSYCVGRISPSWRRVYDTVLMAQERGLSKIRPGVSCREVDRACRNFIEKKGFGRYFTHGTGHGVGLEVHEYPNLSGVSTAVLEPGMVVTVEPGIYLPGRFGVRIEDTVLVTSRGNEVLTGGIHTVNRIDI